MDTNLIAPHGGKLVNLIIEHDRGIEIAFESSDWPIWVLSSRQLVDLELLINGAYSPLSGFMCSNDYESVLKSFRLEDGTFWPLPITLNVTEMFAAKLKSGMDVSLCNQEGAMIAALHIDEIWRPDIHHEKRMILGPNGHEVAESGESGAENNTYYLGGRIEGVVDSTRLDFQGLRLSPAKNREEFTRIGWSNIISYQTISPIHKSAYKFSLNAAHGSDANLLIQLMDNDSHPGDKKYYSLVRSLEAVLPHYPTGIARLTVLRSKLRKMGPREALLQAVIARNCGCSGFILDPELYNPPADYSVSSPVDPGDYANLWEKYKDELGVRMIPFEKLAYIEKLGDFIPKKDVPEGAKTLSLGEEDLSRKFAEGSSVPAWFSFPEVLTELKKAHLPRRNQGFTVFFTGLSGSGKSTIANALLVKLLHINDRPVTLLDGDIVRRNLSSELGFSKEHRDINIRRIGFVASEITKNRGVAICAPIAPYDRIRKEVREIISQLGGFILVYVSTPLEECERRDRKGLYAKARAGIIKEFTGISDPYESPGDAELAIDTTDIRPEDAVREITDYLMAQGYVENYQRDV
jgi:sulfate adenylyltransferase